jgi:hypothetical protein
MSIFSPRQSGARLIFKPPSCKNRPDFYPERKRMGQGEPLLKKAPRLFSTPKSAVKSGGQRPASFPQG